MGLNRLLGRLGRGDSGGIPTLYPGVNPAQLEKFLTDSEYYSIKSFNDVYILPFVSHEGEPTQMSFGMGLSRLMIRNLMLLRDVSIHGPEDTPDVPWEMVDAFAEAHPRSSHVTGVADIGPDGFVLRIDAHRPGQPVKSLRVRQADFKAFLRDCSAAIAQLLGCRITAEIAQAWSVGQPRDANSLIQLGRIHLEFERQQAAERGRAALQIIEADPDFVTALWDLDEELPGARKQYLAGLQRDPHNAQLCFLTFCTIWHSKGPQPEALQFCRKAIELSPGLGKAHMCAPHSAQRPEAMVRHSELGYRLLPGNSFAVNNYTIALTRANAPAAKRIELAQEGIEADPHDPGNYMRLMELYTDLGDHSAALATAERLQMLYEPVMDERALYCLRQNPQMVQLLDSGKFVPAAYNRRQMDEIRARIQG